MKKLTLAMLLLAGITSCTKTSEKEPVVNNADYVCTTCTTMPEAKAEHDNNSGGVYKGVLAGSTGTIALYLHHTGTEVKALVTFDGYNATLTSTDLLKWMPGMTIRNAAFTGTINGNKIDVLFSVDSVGQNPIVLVTYPGHYMQGAVFKETSTQLVKSYEGNYSGDRKGTFNMVIRGAEVAVATNINLALLKGKVVNKTIDVMQEGVDINGTHNADVVSGAWRDDFNEVQGTWTGKRTL